MNAFGYRIRDYIIIRRDIVFGIIKKNIFKYGATFSHQF